MAALKAYKKCMYLRKKPEKCMFLGNCSHAECKYYKQNQKLNDIIANAGYYYLDNNGNKRWKGYA